MRFAMNARNFKHSKTDRKLSHNEQNENKEYEVWSVFSIWQGGNWLEMCTIFPLIFLSTAEGTRPMKMCNKSVLQYIRENPLFLIASVW